MDQAFGKVVPGEWRDITVPQVNRLDLRTWRHHCRRMGNYTRIVGGPGKWVLQAMKKEGK